MVEGETNEPDMNQATQSTAIYSIFVGSFLPNAQQLGWKRQDVFWFVPTRFEAKDLPTTRDVRKRCNRKEMPKERRVNRRKCSQKGCLEKDISEKAISRETTSHEEQLKPEKIARRKKSLVHGWVRRKICPVTSKGVVSKEGSREKDN